VAASLFVWLIFLRLIAHQQERGNFNANSEWTADSQKEVRCCSGTETGLGVAYNPDVFLSRGAQLPSTEETARERSPHSPTDLPGELELYYNPTDRYQAAVCPLPLLAQIGVRRRSSISPATAGVDVSARSVVCFDFRAVRPLPPGFSFVQPSFLANKLDTLARTLSFASRNHTGNNLSVVIVYFPPPLENSKTAGSAMV
jgi:hypothetical protein